MVCSRRRDEIRRKIGEVECFLMNGDSQVEGKHKHRSTGGN